MKPSFQQLIRRLEQYWERQGCAIVQPYDIEVGAGTFHPATFFGALQHAPWRVAYAQPSRRPTDGRYAENPLRTQRYYQYQVLLKPAPADARQLYLSSLEAVGLRLQDHDVRFVEDDWESPTLGAWGLGWEVWMDSLEVTQFTYFQQIGGVDVREVSCEITYGLERIAMYLQRQPDMFRLQWNPDWTYGDFHRHTEQEGSAYNFEAGNTPLYLSLFQQHEGEARQLLERQLLIPAYEQLLKCSHAFNMLDARGAVSVTERPTYVARVRSLAKRCAELFLERQNANKEV